MTRINKSIFAALTLATLIAFTARKAQADPVTFTVTNSGQTVTAGGGVTLTGFYTNPGGQDFIVTAIFIGNPSPNVSFYGTEFSFPTVAPLSSTADAPLLMVTFSSNTNPGIYDLYFGVQGHNPSGPSFENSNLSLFRVTVLPQPVPEPATLLLLGGGLAGMAITARRRARKT